MLQPISDSLGAVIFTCLWQYVNIVIHPLKSIQYGSKCLVAIPFHLLIKISYGIKFLRKSFLKKSYFGICFVFLLKNNVIPSATMAWRKVMCPGACIKPAIYEPNSQVVIQATPTPSFVLNPDGSHQYNPSFNPLSSSLFFWFTSWTSNEILLAQWDICWAMESTNLDQS